MPPKQETRFAKLHNKKLQLIEDLKLFADFVDAYDEAKLEQLKGRLRGAEKLIDEFKNVHLDMRLMGNEEVMNGERAGYVQFENSYWNVIEKANKLIPRAISTSTPLPLQNSVVSNFAEGRMRLPRLQPPSFDGNIQNYQEFVDNFNSSIGDDPSLTDAHKLQYLKAALKGEAADVLSSLNIAAANYATGWELLKQRYENKYLIVKSHLNAITNLQPVTKEYNITLRELSNTLTKNLRCLENLQIPVASWGIMIIHIVTAKLDAVTMREWEMQRDGAELPTLEQFKKFLSNRCSVLEALAAQNITATSAKPDMGGIKKVQAKSPTYIANHTSGCAACYQNHSLQNCDTFRTLSTKGRRELVNRHGLCYKCLSRGHGARFCKAPSCEICKGSHHVKLHIQQQDGTDGTRSQERRVENATQVLSVNGNPADVLLCTVTVQVKDRNGVWKEVRGLLDTAASSSIATLGLCKRLNLPLMQYDGVVNGVNESETLVKHTVDLEIRSKLGTFNKKLRCLVMNEITGNLPSITIDKAKLRIPQHIELADRGFNKAAPIQLLLSNETFWEVLMSRRIPLQESNLIAHQTQLGWIIAGTLGDSKHKRREVACLAIREELSKFFELEGIKDEDVTPLSDEQRAVEEHFKNTMRRDRDGRFIVKLPLKENPSQLGNSMRVAEKRVLSLERRLNSNHDMKAKYIEFMEEYRELKHMHRVEEPNVATIGRAVCYIPHQIVIKKESLTTSHRVVFDASAKTSSGKSLNDILMTGANVQRDLFSILLGFREHRWVVTSDVAKMYRQVLVDETQTSLQRILWRADPREKLQIWELNRVTYGTSSAAYLATRCVKELGLMMEKEEPEIANAIINKMYVDDYLDGGDDVEDVLRKSKRVAAVLASAGFILRKWRSNNANILEKLETAANDEEQFSLGESEGKTLGLYWSAQSDTLFFRYENFTTSSTFTKRMVLSCIARIYDPLGILSPCTIYAKIFLQRLWLEGINWDDAISGSFEVDWNEFVKELPHLNEVRVPRHARLDRAVNTEIHGFADSSEVAYGACVYLRTTSDVGEIQVQLLCAKSKVAPIKSLSIPKLELCAALILSRLIGKVAKALNTGIDRIVTWSDSTVTLGWLKTSPHLLKPFVGNRVAEIQSSPHGHHWRHVSTKSNPSDLLSRGLRPSSLKNSKLWFTGPTWLSKEEACWPINVPLPTIELPEERKTARINNLAMLTVRGCHLLQRYSSLKKLLRIVAYCLRLRGTSKRGENAVSPTAEELEEALIGVIKMSQALNFAEELGDLRRAKLVENRSCLSRLNPFLDDKGIIRVGGRLKMAQLHYDAIHQIVLPSKCSLTKLILEQEHQNTLHGGAQLILSNIRQRFWPVAGRDLARKITRNCIVCFKTKPINNVPPTGQLPAERLNPLHPFSNVGCDYAGPFSLKDRKGRGSKQTKAYVCTFVCFATKAVHLELVGDLSTASFIAVLRRFIARRGKPTAIFSDNATNFVGARNELRELGEFLKLEEAQEGVSHAMSEEGVTFKFVPPRAPNFAGLAEASVKSFKYHLRRVAGTASFTYEEFLTLLYQVEATLNSRPLTPLSSDPNDLNPLTPGHFLIGRPLTSLPCKNYSSVPTGRLQRFEMIQQVLQHFWKRWSKELLNEYQQGCQRGRQVRPLDEGSLVIIKEDNLPPSRWLVGRVSQLIKGPDGVTRVAMVKTANGSVKRAVRKLCVLPTECA